MKDQQKDIVQNNKIRRRVKLLINEYGVKQSFISNNIGEHKGSFNGWVKGTRNYDNSKLYKLATFLEKKYGDLLNKM